MNIWVEYFRLDESVKWKPPKPSEVSRRFFDKNNDANSFAKRMNEKGYHATVKRDQSL
jgi:hypothetical protein|tara:strand:+ start:531 stop:704 length:174 start_codon:yes stop_codon:yes gene_type:complete